MGRLRFFVPENQTTAYLSEQKIHVQSNISFLLRITSYFVFNLSLSCCTFGISRPPPNPDSFGVAALQHLSIPLSYPLNNRVLLLPPNLKYLVGEAVLGLPEYTQGN